MKAGHTQCAEAVCEVIRKKCEHPCMQDVIVIASDGACV